MKITLYGINKNLVRWRNYKSKFSFLIFRKLVDAFKVYNLYLGHNGTWKLNFSYPFTEYIISKRKNLQLNLKDSIYQSDIEHLKKIKSWFTQAPDIIWKD